MESKWIKVEDQLPDDGSKVIVWQNNLSDPSCSRHHCAHFYNYGNSNSFHIYPTVYHLDYYSDKEYKDSDLEGDTCQLTHWMPLPEQPKN